MRTDIRGDASECDRSGPKLLLLAARRGSKELFAGIWRGQL